MKPADEAPRIGSYRRDADLDVALDRMNRAIASADWSFLGTAREPERPVVLVVGLQRSGTTLLMQILAEAFELTAPDNVVARFWRAPWVGVMVSRSLRGQELVDTRSSFRSDHGVARDLLGPHEFGYFWTRFFDFSRGHRLDEDALAKVDVPGLRLELARMEAAAGMPLLFKAVPLSFNLPFVVSALPTARLVHVERDPLEVAVSTYAARVARHGRADAWWSLRPPGHEELAGLDPARQVAGQVVRSREVLAEGLRQVDGQRVIRIRYEELCRQPLRCVDALAGGLDGVARRQGRTAIPKRTAPSEGPPLPAGVRQRIARALEGFEDPR